MVQQSLVVVAGQPTPLIKVPSMAPFLRFLRARCSQIVELRIVPSLIGDVPSFWQTNASPFLFKDVFIDQAQVQALMLELLGLTFPRLERLAVLYYYAMNNWVHQLPPVLMRPQVPF